MYQFSTKPGCENVLNIGAVLTTEPNVSKHSLTYLKTYFSKKYLSVLGHRKEDVCNVYIISDLSTGTLP